MITDKKLIFRLFPLYVKSIGVISLDFFLSPYKKTYLLWSYSLCFLFVLLNGIAESWFCLCLPPIPLILLLIGYLIDLNIMVRGLVNIQKILLRDYMIAVDLELLLEYFHEYAKSAGIFRVFGAKSK